MRRHAGIVKIPPRRSRAGPTTRNQKSNRGGSGLWLGLLRVRRRTVKGRFPAPGAASVRWLVHATRPWAEPDPRSSKRRSAAVESFLSPFSFDPFSFQQRLLLITEYRCFPWVPLRSTHEACVRIRCGSSQKMLPSSQVFQCCNIFGIAPMKLQALIRSILHREIYLADGKAHLQKGNSPPQPCAPRALRPISDAPSAGS